MKSKNTTLVIGLVGCGHLGLALAKSLVANGYSKESLRLSFGGNPATLKEIREANLESCISTNADIFAHSDIVFITIRPDSIKILEGVKSNPHCLIVSCVAGVSCATLKEILGVEVIRLMPSSPQSIETKTGIAALYPSTPLIEDLLSDLDLETVVLDKEQQLHLFTSLVCLPAAYLQMQITGLARKEPDLLSFSNYYFDKASLVIKWAEENTPTNLTNDAIVAYIARMATKGGITEAIVESIKHRSDLNTALIKGIQRGEMIAG